MSPVDRIGGAGVLIADAATVMFGRRLRFQALLRMMRDDGCGHVIDLSECDAEAEAPGISTVLRHARELRLGGQRQTS